MKILIVEDSMFVQNMTRKIVQERVPNCEIATASSGDKGYELYNEFKPDLVLTDLLMPGMSGQELLAKIRETDKTTRVIVISADVQKATRDDVEALGIEGFISKPLSGEKADLLIQLIGEAAHVPE